MTFARGAMMAVAVLIAAPGSAQVTVPLSPYPECSPNKASNAPCMCGIRPATVCSAGSWCSFTPEGAPLCTRTRPLHR